MELSNFIKKLKLKEGIDAPSRLTYGDLIATPLTRKDIEADLIGVNSSIEIIRKTRGGKWPTKLLSKEDDLLDLAWHEREFVDGSSLTYIIRNEANEYLGCFYLYGMGYRTVLSESFLQYDVDASWWVTATAYDEGQYDKAYFALKYWLKNDFQFENPYFSNKEIPHEQ